MKKPPSKLSAWFRKSAFLLLIIILIGFLFYVFLSLNGSNFLESILPLLMLFGLFYIYSITTLPLHLLPSLALIVSIAIPIVAFRLIPIPEIAGLAAVLSPASITFAAWGIRRWLNSQRLSEAIEVNLQVSISLLLLVIILAILASNDLQKSIGWTISIFLWIGPFIFLKPTEIEAQSLMRAWISGSSITGLYAIYEYQTKTNPLYGILYDHLTDDNSQHWSEYRAQVSFGHPLYAGLFMAAGAILCVFRIVDSKRLIFILPLLASILGVLVTLSRGSLVALVVSLLLGSVILIIRRSTGTWRLISLGLVLTIAGLASGQLEGVLARGASDEGQVSAGGRLTGIRASIEAVSAGGWLGYGPGTSQSAVSSFNETGVLIESSPVQLLLSIGIVGLILFSLVIFFAVNIAIRNGNIEGGMLLVCVAVALATFNGIDGAFSTHTWLGLAVFASIYRPLLKGQKIRHRAQKN